MSFIFHDSSRALRVFSDAHTDPLDTFSEAVTAKGPLQPALLHPTVSHVTSKQSKNASLIHVYNAPYLVIASLRCLFQMRIAENRKNSPFSGRRTK